MALPLPLTIEQAQQRLSAHLNDLYDRREAGQIAQLVMEKITGMSRMDRMLNKEIRLSIEQERQYDSFSEELLSHRPVQYVLGEAWFCGLKFRVDESVLIPRPETEELVNWAKEEVKKKKTGERITIIDIGTGSGIIAISLKNSMPHISVIAIDSSDVALQTAMKNAMAHKTDIQFQLVDFLDPLARKRLPQVDLIVSNPPYIPLTEKGSLDAHVTDHEPHLALFVPDHDALVFYSAITEFGITHLKRGGSVFVEIHEERGAEVSNLFDRAGYRNITLKKDIQGKDRMVKAGRDDTA